jgi:hypothetical protein
MDNVCIALWTFGGPASVAEPSVSLNVISCKGPDPNGVPYPPTTTRRQDQKSLKLRQQPANPEHRLRGVFLLGRKLARYVLVNRRRAGPGRSRRTVRPINRRACNLMS